MGTCDVSKKSRYGVESYDYTIKYRLDDNYISKKVFSSNDYNQTNKRKFSDRSNIKLRLGQRVNSHQPVQEKQESRVLPDLVVTSEDSLENLAVDIAEKLAEEKKDLVSKYLILKCLCLPKSMLHTNNILHKPYLYIPVYVHMSISLF